MTVLKDVFEIQPGSDAQQHVDGILSIRTAPSASYTPWLKLPSPEVLRSSLVESVAATIDRYAQGSAGAAATRSNAYDLRRGAWQALCPIRRDSLVLDFGCGLGAVSRSLARNCRGVIGIDACYERLMINAAINREEAVANIGLVFGDHETLAALRPSSVDGVVLNGVLEWVPEYVEGDPYDAQLSFLRTCRRALKDDGWLYLGIENRWGFRYFLGRPDEHTGMIGSSLLPRPLANLYSRAVRRRPYRTLTHGPVALADLLGKAGFGTVERYAPIPDYRHFEIITRLDGIPERAEAARHLGVTKRWKQRVLELGPIFATSVPSLGYVASPRTTARRPWLEDLGSPMSHVYVKYDQASVWYGRDRRQVRDVALSSEAISKLEHIERLGSVLADQPGCPLALKGFRVHRGTGYVWADRSYVEGRVLEALPKLEQQQHMDAVLGRLRQIHQLGAYVPGASMTLMDVFTEWAPNARRDLPRTLLQRLHDLIGHLHGASGVRILMHGDFSVKNIVLAGNGPELIDWEWSRAVSFAGYDVLKLVWHDLEDPARPPAAALAVDRYFEDGHARRSHARVHDDDLWPTSVATYWVCRLARSIGRYRYGGMPQGWPEQHVEHVAALLASRLKPQNV